MLVSLLLPLPVSDWVLVLEKLLTKGKEMFLAISVWWKYFKHHSDQHPMGNISLSCDLTKKKSLEKRFIADLMWRLIGPFCLKCYFKSNLSIKELYCRWSVFKKCWSMDLVYSHESLSAYLHSLSSNHLLFSYGHCFPY